jgi:hypothetical protein
LVWRRQCRESTLQPRKAKASSERAKPTARYGEGGKHDESR